MKEETKKFMSSTIIKLFLLISLLSLYNTQAPRIHVKTSYSNEEKIDILSGTVNSFKTQIPYDLYYLDICAPEDVFLVPSNLGEIILQGKSYHTGYEIKINQNKKCQKLCTKKISNKSFKRLSNLIKKEYFVNYYLDNLPVGLTHTNIKNKQKEVRYTSGIPVGFQKNNQLYIYNHYKINIILNEFNEDKNEVINNQTIIINETKYSIIGFDIEPFSFQNNDTISINKANTNNENDENINSNVNVMSNNQICEDYFNKKYLEELKESDDDSNITDNGNDKKKKKKNENYQKLLKNSEITFTYDIEFYFTNVTYDERMNKYFAVDNSIHWTSIIISGIIILILTTILVLIFIRSIKTEIEIHNEKVDSDEEINEYGWRQVAFDVFRRPYRSDVLAAIFGTGIQLTIMIIYALLFVALGILKPRNGGSYFTLLVTTYIFLSLISGYFSSRFYKLVHGLRWLRVSVLTSFLFPTIFIILLSSTNGLYYLEGSSTYVDFKSLFSLSSLWLTGSVPLLLIGSLVANSQRRVEIPCDINPVPGLIPADIPWYFRIRFSWIFTGFPSFFAVFVELFYIMDSMWKQNIYSLSKYLLISLVVLIITSSEIGILFTYLNLCKGDYRWWWKSFFASASPGLYFIIFALLYLFKMGFNQFSSIAIYLNFMILLTVMVSFICGSCGLLLTFIFLRTIYSKIKLN